MDDLMKTTILLIESELRSVELQKKLDECNKLVDAHLEMQFDMPTQEEIEELEQKNSKLKNQVEYYIQLLHIDQLVAQTKEKYN